MRWICKRSLEAPQRYEWAQVVLSWLIYLTRTRTCSGPRFHKSYSSEVWRSCEPSHPHLLFSSLPALPSCFLWLGMSQGVRLSLCVFSLPMSFILFPARAGRHRLCLICHFVHRPQDQRDRGAEDDYISGTRESYLSITWTSLQQMWQLHGWLGLGRETFIKKCVFFMRELNGHPRVAFLSLITHHLISISRHASA